jgi:glycosyltransferase involved in cell wall biosynthesis
VQDPAALAAAWQRLLALPAAERAALGAKAREKIQKEFSLKAMVDQTGQILSSLS